MSITQSLEDWVGPTENATGYNRVLGDKGTWLPGQSRAVWASWRKPLLCHKGGSQSHLPRTMTVALAKCICGHLWFQTLGLVLLHRLSQ